MIPALVLTAGLATRLRPLSFVRAKAAMPVAGDPLVRRILRQLRTFDIRDAVLNLHHLPHTITAVVGDGSDLDVRVRYSWETPILGSAGGPRQALPLLGARTFLIANGDTLTTADVAALIADHHQSGALVTMAVVPNTQAQKYGGVVVDDRGAVIGFTRPGSSERSYHFVGMQVVEAAAFDSIASGAVAESVGAVYPALIARRPGSIRAHICDADVVDIGTPGDYLATSIALARRDGGVLHGLRTRIHPMARVEASVLWDDVNVEAGVSLRECVIADNTRVPADTSWAGVSLRPAAGELAPGERRIGDIAVASL